MRKTWELYLSLILQFRPSHCPPTKDKQRRAHADMYQYPARTLRVPDNNYTPVGIYRCPVFFVGFKVAKFEL